MSEIPEAGSPRQNSNIQPPTIDPTLAALFQDSVSAKLKVTLSDSLIGLQLGPVKSAANSVVLSKKDRPDGLPKTSKLVDNAIEDPASDSGGEEEDGLISKLMALPSTKIVSDSSRRTRKRKRRDAEDDVEGRYLDQLAQEEVERQHDDLQSGPQQKRHKSRVPESLDRRDTSPDLNEEPEIEDAKINAGTKDMDVFEDVPRHESIVAPREDLDLEKSLRTIFLANVSTLAIKSRSARKALIEHLSSFMPLSPDQGHKPSVESLRFRSIAFASNVIPKKAAFAKKDLMDTTTQSTNAYVVYSTQSAAREASKRLNGTMVLERHLRVDSVAHPAMVEHRKCVFVGNLGFVDDMTDINAAQDEDNKRLSRKAKEPADVEEGLWRQFGKAGVVDSVRVIRDKKTRVGKGFAYVQFKDENAVEKALLFDGKKFPPMLPRILRVTRAKNLKKAAGQREKKTPFKSRNISTAGYSPKIPGHIKSLHGRADKLLGHAGAAKMKAAGENRHHSSSNPTGMKTPESIVFEGHRASKPQGKGQIRTGGSGKTVGKPRTRSSKRGAEFMARGGKKKTRS